MGRVVKSFSYGNAEDTAFRSLSMTEVLPGSIGSAATLWEPCPAPIDRRPKQKKYENSPLDRIPLILVYSHRIHLSWSRLGLIRMSRHLKMAFALKKLIKCRDMSRHLPESFDI